MNAIRLAIEPAPADAVAGAYARVCCFGTAQEAPFELAFTVAPEDAALLRWAAIEYPEWPFGGFAERAALAGQRAAEVGKALYAETIARVAASTPSRVVIETAVAEALRLPWELLHDGNDFIALGKPSCEIVRSTPAASSSGMSPAPSEGGRGPLRILLVTARPNDAPAVDLRLVAQRLYRRISERIREGAVVVEYLRPPTFEALAARLSAVPAVDVVHFDGHGTTELGGRQIAPSLVFENARQMSDLVRADRYAQVLGRAGVATTVLTACDTGAVTRNPMHSAASAIVAGGAAAVVAMGDEILVESAAQYVDVFYGVLAFGGGIGAAHAAARTALATRADFHADWWTPQLYVRDGSATFGSDVRSAPGVGASVVESDRKFFGRAAELLAIDRAIAAGSPVVLRGFAGAGKSALAREAGDWLTMTGACESVREIDCSGGATKVIGSLGALSAPAASASRTRALVTLDGLELADEAAKAAALASALEGLAARYAVIVTTRDMRDGSALFSSPASWRFITVDGLDTASALEFAHRAGTPNAAAADTMDRHAAEAAIESAGGFPFGIVAHTGANAPTGDAAFAVWDPTIATSLARLSTDDRALVSKLRELVRGGNVFTARTLVGVERDRFAAFIDELRRVGLGDAFPLTNLPEGRMLCLKLHPALTPLERLRNGTDKDMALCYARAYEHLAASLAVGNAPDPTLPARFYTVEKPNLERAVMVFEALDMGKEAAALRTSLDALAGQFGGHVDAFAIGPQTFEGAEAALQAAREALDDTLKGEPPDPIAVANARVVLGIALDRSGDTNAAADQTQQACAALADIEAAVPSYILALRSLGGLQHKLARNDDARATLKKAEPLVDRSDRAAAIAVHLQLGDLALAVNDFDDASAQYGLAQKLAYASSAGAEEAAALFGLEGIAYKRRDLTNAERLTREAIATCASIGDIRRIASGYLTLGSIAVDRKLPAEADSWFETLRGCAGYAACDGRTRAFFDASIACELERLVFDWLGTDRAVASAKTISAWHAAVQAFMRSDPQMQRRLAAAKQLAERVVAEHGNDPGCAGVTFARPALDRIAKIEGGGSETESPARQSG